MTDLPRLDKTHFSVMTREEADREDIMYWRGKTPAERLAAIEVLRQIVYGYDPETSRMKRVFEVIDRESI